MSTTATTPAVTSSANGSPAVSPKLATLGGLLASLAAAAAGLIEAIRTEGDPMPLIIGFVGALVSAVLFVAVYAYHHNATAKRDLTWALHLWNKASPQAQEAVAAAELVDPNLARNADVKKLQADVAEIKAAVAVNRTPPARGEAEYPNRATAPNYSDTHLSPQLNQQQFTPPTTSVIPPIPAPVVPPVA